jgi:hypothetical protein
MDHFLRGAWAFSRSISCRLTSTVTRVVGTASWLPLTPAPDERAALEQVEDGLLALPGAAPGGTLAPLPVTAKYSWHWPDGGGAALVRFPDGRPFVADVDFLAAPCAVAHACAPDAYEGHFERDGDGAFVVVWTVTGPRKDYVSVTRFTRQ